MLAWGNHVTSVRDVFARIYENVNKKSEGKTKRISLESRRREEMMIRRLE